MKIRIEMTSEETAKTIEFIKFIILDFDISELMSADQQHVEVKCNICKMDIVADPVTGIATGFEIETRFIMWMLRKMKPFISVIVSLWGMIIDFFEDVEMMTGEVTVLRNGKSLDVDDKELRMVHRVYTSDPEHRCEVNRVFNDQTTAFMYMEETTKFNTKYVFFYVPKDFDFGAPTPTHIEYKDRHIDVIANGAASVNIDGTRILCSDIYNALNCIDDDELNRFNRDNVEDL